MANTFSDVVPILVAQALPTLRAACLLPRLVNTDYGNAPAEKYDTINVWIASAQTVADVAPSAAPFQAQDSLEVKVPIPLNKWRHSGFYLTDKQQEEVVAGVQSRQTTEAIKSLAEDINAFLFGTYTSIYGIQGTPGTTPFAADITGATLTRKQLNLQRAPLTDRRLILDVNAEANALGLAQFTTVQNTGNDQGIIEGTIGRKFGFDVAMDQQVPTHPSVALSAGALTVNGVNAVGAGSTNGGRSGTISLAKATNAGSFIQGDIITIAGFSQTYVVTAATALIVGNTTVPIAPALQQATAGGEAVTLKAAHVVNLGIHRDCIAFASRPLQASSANVAEMMSIVDPVSGVAFRLEVVRQNKQMFFDFDVLFGGACVRPELGVRLAG